VEGLHRAARYRRVVPLQNRVTPRGEIIATPARGTMIGNRGVLHDEDKRIIRTSQLRRWLCCVLEFKGRRRTVMTPRRWTELFFLDEATAMAAGHRPCFECRRRAALQFQACWARAFGVLAKADGMDRVLHEDRRIRGGRKKTYRASLRGLPQGTFVEREDAAWLFHRGRLWRWTPEGYDGSQRVGAGEVVVLTPRAITAILREGYMPAVHASAF
jgi:hypothetical protein